MSLKPFDRFVSFQTHHCVTGSMRHIYAFNRHGLGEELLPWLGEGVGFIYLQARRQAPFLGGRSTRHPVDRYNRRRFQTNQIAGCRLD